MDENKSQAPNQDVSVQVKNGINENVQLQNHVSANNQAQNVATPISSQQTQNSNVTASSTDVYSNHQQKSYQEPDIDPLLLTDDPNQPRKKSYKALIWLGTIIVVIVLIILGYYFPYKNYLRGEAVRKIVPDRSNAGWQAYTSKDGKMSYQMPSSASHQEDILGQLAQQMGLNSSKVPESTLFTQLSTDPIFIGFTRAYQDTGSLLAEQSFSSVEQSLTKDGIKFAKKNISIAGQPGEVLCPAAVAIYGKTSPSYCEVIVYQKTAITLFKLIVGNTKALSDDVAIFNKFLGSVKFAD